MIQNNYKFNKRGITLLELLVVIGIVGILAAVAIPSYNSYMVRARRSDAKTALEQVRGAQEMYKAETGRYALQIQNTLDRYGVSTTAGDYNITFTVATATTFTARATPSTSRQSSDGWLEINHNGTKTDQNGFTYPDPRCKWSK